MTQTWKNLLHNKKEISTGTGNSFFSRKNANPCRWNRKLILQISVATFSVWWENALIFWRRLMQFGKLNFLATLGRREKLLLSGRNVRTRLYSSSLAKSSWNLKTLIIYMYLWYMVLLKYPCPALIWEGGQVCFSSFYRRFLAQN